MILLLASVVAIGVLWMRPPPSAEAPKEDAIVTAAPPVEPVAPPVEEPMAEEDHPAALETPGVVRATAFVLVDAEGRTRAELRAGDHGESTLTFTDDEGALRATFGVLDGGSSGYELADGTGRKWVDMACYHRGGATLIFEDEVVKRQLYLGMWDDDVTRMTFGRGEKSVLDLWDDEDGMSIRGDSVRTPWDD